VKTFAIGVVCVLLWSCGAQERSVPSPTPPTVSHLEFKEPRVPFSIVERATRIARAIAALRGWSNDLAITYEVANLPRVRQAIAADLFAQTSAETLEAQTSFLASFGWIPANFQTKDAILQAFSPEVLGLYCMTWHRVLLAASVPPAALDSVLRHELVHAFQDRNFHLSQRVRWAPNRGDAIAAVHALAEGEAVCVTRELEDPTHRGCRDTPTASEDRVFAADISRLPPVIQYGMLSPYADGIRFVSKLLRQGGWRRVDSAWRDGLNSTRELLGLPSQIPPDVRAPFAPPGFYDCKAEMMYVLGAQGLASVLYETGDPETARRFASVLQWDRAASWRCRQGCANAWHLRTEDSSGGAALSAALKTAIGIPRTTERASPGCGILGSGVWSLLHDLRDIVITSVRNCDLSESEFVEEYCELTVNWAGQLIRQPAD